MQPQTNKSSESLQVMAMHELLRKMKKAQETVIRDLKAKIDELEAEVSVYRSELAEYEQMAASYGIDAKTMCTLAKSQIKTCADNIRLREQMEETQSFIRFIAACTSTDPFAMEIIRHCRELAEVSGEL